ncbi:Outer membrane vitamin B12 receptor BtuB [hydrothermal vent metagenome]|uniref:Outer membrane vitamin B12 receptor BtuB n=1 Tax=hydrothermal vent metagenome TaxID=652676 RepID=A0A3B1CHY2_9ZZZZ
MKKLCLVLLLPFFISVPSFAAEDRLQSQTTEENKIKKFEKGKALAEVIILPKMAVTATRSQEDVKKIPAKIEVIDDQDVALTVGETLTEQLKKNSSVNVIEYPGVLAGIGIRGFRPEFSGITKHTLILINGRPAGATNLATILADNIERIEVLKGPASSLYGGEAMGGVVNIITRKNTGALTGMAEIGYGSFETYFLKTALGGEMGKGFDFDLFARRFEQADDFKMGNGQKRANTAYQTQNGNLRIGRDFAESWRLDMSGDLYQGRDIETPGDIFNGDAKSGRKDIDRYGMDLSISGELSHNNTLALTAYKTNETSESYRNFIGFTNPVQVAPYQSFDSEIDWLGFQVKDEHTWDEYRFITGIDYQDINKKSRSYNQDGSSKAPFSPDEGRENWGAYLETIGTFLNNRLTTTLGARYDTFKVETKTTPFKTDFRPNAERFSTFSPRAGLSFNVGQGIRLHSTVGKAFVPPGAAQLAGYAERVVSGVTMITRGNENLDPESSLSYDLGLGYDRPQSGLSLDFTYFHTEVDDRISRVTRGNITTFENSLGAVMEGLEADISFDLAAPLEWERSVSFFANTTYMLKAEEEQIGGTTRDIQNVAEYTLNYGVQYDDGKVDGKLHFRSQGRMKDTEWNTPGFPETEYPTFTVVDLVLRSSFREHHLLTLKVDNLTDKDYFEKKGFPKPGRGFYLSYAYQF